MEEKLRKEHPVLEEGFSCSKCAHWIACMERSRKYPCSEFKKKKRGGKGTKDGDNGCG